MTALLRGDCHNYDELALDYAGAGLWEEAVAVLDLAIAQGAVSPMTHYYKAWALAEGGMSGAAEALERAEDTDPACCFPNRLEAILALRKAMELNPQGSKAPYYLGNLFYDKRQYDLATEAWERSAREDARFPTVWRNLALAWFNKQGNAAKAVEAMERAFHLDESDSRVLMELDQLYKRIHRSHAERLAFLEKYPELIAERDDLLLEEITLLNQTGQYCKAKKLLDAHTFHPWEGGEGKVPAQYQFSRVELAKQALADKEYEKAVRLLGECLEYPRHLGEGKLQGAQENDFYYLMGIAYEALGNHNKAVACWEKATEGPQEPAAALYYNDAKPDKIFYQGLSLRKLGREAEAQGRFDKLIDYGERHLCDKPVMDYFAVSLPDLLIWEDSLETKNLIHCKYMLALGYFGLGDSVLARKYLSEVEALDNNHQGILQLKTLIGLFISDETG